MSGFLFTDTVFGPVMSRRLGVSLGINLLPIDYKYCTFNCIYCECGWTHEKPDKREGLPSREMVKELLEKRLIGMQEEGKAPDAITFAGNGEPTIHPAFAEIIDDTILLRNAYFPEAKITVLSNASMLNREKVFNALLKVDNNIQKLDAGTENLFQLINQPAGKLSLNNVVDQLCRFEGKLIVQTLFLKTKRNDVIIDNTESGEVAAWLQLLKKINPEYVMIYPVDRATPDQNIEKISFDQLNLVADRVKNEGIKIKVFG